MTKKLVKALAATLCAVVLIVGTIAGTVAYLTSTDKVQNTFTAGKVAIEMDEKNLADVSPARVKANTYKLVPGRTYVNELTIHVEAKSEPCYLFVKVDEKFLVQNPAIQLQFANGWDVLHGANNATGVYYYNVKVDASAAENNVDVPVIEQFTVKPEAKSDNFSGYTGASGLSIVAYAVQCEGFNDNVAAAWNATFGVNQVQP